MSLWRIAAGAPVLLRDAQGYVGGIAPVQLQEHGRYARQLAQGQRRISQSVHDGSGPQEALGVAPRFLVNREGHELRIQRQHTWGRLPAKDGDLIADPALCAAIAAPNGDVRLSRLEEPAWSRPRSHPMGIVAHPHDEAVVGPEQLLVSNGCIPKALPRKPYSQDPFAGVSFIRRILPHDTGVWRDFRQELLVPRHLHAQQASAGGGSPVAHIEIKTLRVQVGHRWIRDAMRAHLHPIANASRVVHHGHIEVRSVAVFPHRGDRVRQRGIEQEPALYADQQDRDKGPAGACVDAWHGVGIRANSGQWRSATADCDRHRCLPTAPMLLPDAHRQLGNAGLFNILKLTRHTRQILQGHLLPLQPMPRDGEHQKTFGVDVPVVGTSCHVLRE
mmetsp:Transcript_8621/g.24794  ORF Transcript_8621/g.24794 Transcript_8621/m.24794 type:complete len:389 (-) Transcript_8621:364-1530(-)